jgi:hypothetical protein
VFHDGMKEWSCCKKKSHDFGEFMGIKGYYARSPAGFRSDACARMEYRGARAVGENDQQTDTLRRAYAERGAH